jgi:hypothetical protein
MPLSHTLCNSLAIIARNSARFGRQRDEICSFVGAKERTIQRDPSGAGSLLTWRPSSLLIGRRPKAAVNAGRHDLLEWRQWQ